MKKITKIQGPYFTYETQAAINSGYIAEEWVQEQYCNAGYQILNITKLFEEAFNRIVSEGKTPDTDFCFNEEDDDDIEDELLDYFDDEMTEEGASFPRVTAHLGWYKANIEDEEIIGVLMHLMVKHVKFKLTWDDEAELEECIRYDNYKTFEDEVIKGLHD